MSKKKIDISPFREKVYATLRKVPKGKVITYGELGKACGCNSARAIGGALRHNPFAPEVPCHRVIKSDSSIGGFSGQTKGKLIEKKLRLLKKEGVLFNSDNRLIDKNRLITADSACLQKSKK